MAYKLVIDDSVKVPVKFTLNSGGKIVQFAFSVTCDRLDTEAFKAFFEDKEKTPKDLLLGIVTGWDGQKLVVEEDGTPAQFSAEALAMMLSTAGVEAAIYSAYLKESVAKEKN